MPKVGKVNDMRVDNGTDSAEADLWRLAVNT